MIKKLFFYKKCYENKIFVNNILRIFIFIGVFLVIYQFLYNRGLWLDESFLALNIVKRDFIGLLKPLLYSQAAPIGFLFVEKFFCMIFSNTDWSLRLFPLIVFLLSIPLYYKLVLKLSKIKTLALLACSLYTISIQMIRYATEAKQYSTDVFCAIIILLATVNFVEKQSKKNFLVFCLTGIISIWFSNISSIMLFTVGLYSLFKNRKNRKDFINIMIAISCWLISFSVYFIFFIHNQPIKKFMVNFWTKHFNALFDKKLLSIDYLFFIITKVRDTFAVLNFNKFFIVWFIAAILFFIVYPYINIKRKEKGLVFLTLFPIIVHLILSSLKIYPYYHRFILYFIPLLLFIYSFLVLEVFKFIKNYIKNNIINILLLIPLIFSMFKTYNYFPYQEEEGKKMIKLINKNISEKDILYIRDFSGCKGAVSLFYKNYYKNTKHKKVHWFHGDNIEELEILSQEIKNFLYENKHQKVWISARFVSNTDIDRIISSLKNQKELKVKSIKGKCASALRVELSKFYEFYKQ